MHDWTRKRFATVGLSLLLGGCTITQTARPVTLQATDPRTVCVIEDPTVDQSFLPAFTSALERKGLAVKRLPPGSPPTACPLTSTYYARWSWDFTPYMSLARITVYRDGVEVGDALYDAPKAGTALTTRIYDSTESKVGSMVDQLFPGGPVSASR
ncbi:hypothetical protein KF840_08430 [bacterium]|nr:hypothetical protein [bacterium]